MRTKDQLDEVVPESEWLSLEHIAALMDVSPSTVSGWVRKGDLPGFKLRNIVRVHKKAFSEFLTEHSTL